MKKLHLNPCIPAFCLLLLSMVCFPEASVKGASFGLQLWWQRVIPSLLPFFITAEVLTENGAFLRLSRVLSPLCRLFALPDAASSAIVMGLLSGYPTGAAICDKLLTDGSISKSDASRLLCFTNNCSPLFITAAVCTSMLALPKLGGYMLLLHYGISLTYGIIAARLCRNKKNLQADYCPSKPSPYCKDSFGLLLKSASLKSVSRIALIGCYLTFFSLLCAIAEHIGLFYLLAKPLTLWGMDSEILSALFCGMTEMTLGIMKTSSAAPTGEAIRLCALLLSFGGISVQMQVYAMIAEHRLSFAPYMLSCFIKGIAAYLLSMPLYSLFAVQTASGIQPLPSHLTTLLPSLICIAMIALLWQKKKLR